MVSVPTFRCRRPSGRRTGTPRPRHPATATKAPENFAPPPRPPRISRISRTPRPAQVEGASRCRRQACTKSTGFGGAFGGKAPIIPYIPSPEKLFWPAPGILPVKKISYVALSVSTQYGARTRPWTWDCHRTAHQWCKKGSCPAAAVRTGSPCLGR